MRLLQLSLRIKAGRDLTFGSLGLLHQSGRPALSPLFLRSFTIRLAAASSRICAAGRHITGSRWASSLWAGNLEALKEMVPQLAGQLF